MGKFSYIYWFIF